MVAEFKKDNGIDLAADKMALQRLYEAAEKAKIELSSTMTTQINLPFITATQEGPKHLDLQLTRAKLEEITADLLARTVGPTKQALSDAGLDASKIDHVVLVGGMTRMPAVQDEGQGDRRQGPAQGRQPGRGRRRRRRAAGRRAQGRGEGHPPARRHAAVARHRDQGRRHDEADRAQHDHPDEEVRGVHHRGGQPALGRGARAPGRVGDGDVQQDARQVPARRHPAGAAGHAAGRGRVRHRRERDHQRLGEGHGHGQRAADPDPGRLRALGERGAGDDPERGGARRRGAQAEGDRRREEPGGDARLPDRALAQGAPRQARRGRRLDDRGPRHGAAAGARGRRPRRHPREDGRAPGGLAQARRGGLRAGDIAGAVVRAAAAAPRPPRTRWSRRASTRSSTSRSTRRRRRRNDRRDSRHRGPGAGRGESGGDQIAALDGRARRGGRPLEADGRRLRQLPQARGARAGGATSRSRTSGS